MTGVLGSNFPAMIRVRACETYDSGLLDDYGVED